MREWGFWEWLAYACIAVAAIALAVDQAAKGSPALADKLAVILDTGVWHYMPLFLVIVSGITVIANQFGFVGSNNVAKNPLSEHSNLEASFIRTSLRLQFFGDYRTPIEISSRNVATWYAYYSPSMNVTFKDADGKEIGGQGMPPSWAIFITLDKPTAYRQGIVSFSNPEKAPPMEVRFATTRSMVSTVAGQVPAGVLEVHIEE